MKTTKEHIKVLSTLSLAASDAREDTLSSVVISTIQELSEIKKSELGGWIVELFGFDPYREELEEILEKLVEEGKVEQTDQSKLSLSQEEKERFNRAEIELRDKDKARFQNFASFITEEQQDDIDILKIRLLWITFVEYLYNNFYDYGEEALKRLHPHINHKGEIDKEDDYYQIAFSKLKDKELCKLFKTAVEKFPDYASRDDIDFLNDLAQKTLSFASLGIDPKLSSTSLKLSLIDWVLYLDTNVLYSLLDLHSHPENEACKALIALINENKDHLKITLRYSELTKKELNAKRDDFNLLDDKLTNSSIRALLRSEDLDDFSKQFYQNLLNDRDSTLHPSKVIAFASNTLNKNGVDIARNAKRVEKIGEDYLDTRIQDYRRYIDDKNDFKRHFCEEKNICFYPIYKSDKQITHDITLRELILDQRTSKTEDSKVRTFNSIKYFGATIDGLLREYDTRQIKDYGDERSFPVFFRPSFLLSKLVKILPIKTADYKKAFIKAVTSKGFNKDVRKSNDILKIVNYLKSQGIDDEQVVYNLISENLFLEKYKKIKDNPDFNQEEFFESELNREFKLREEELTKTKSALIEKENEAKDKQAISSKLESKKATLETELELYRKAINQLKSDVKKLEKKTKIEVSNQTQINFEAEEAKKELKQVKIQLRAKIESEIEQFKLSKFKSWQKSIWRNLFWVAPMTVCPFTIILFPNLISSLTVDSTSIRVLLGFVLLIVDSIFLFLIKSRYWDEGNKQKRLENTKVPKELTDELKNL